jgi:RHS repeat-associated protein
MSLVPAGVVAAAATGAVVASAAPARAVSGSVLILGTSVNGGTSSAEAQAVPSGFTVTVASAATWDAMTTAQFQAYSALVIGDPSTTSCSTAPPAAAVSDAATWSAAVSGNVAVVGTAPAFAGSAGTALLSDAISYAAGGSGTGLYVSLNCEDATDAAGSVTGASSGDGGWLAGVEDPGGAGFTDTGQGGSCPDSGTVNTLEADTAAAFNGLANSSLASWAAPACSVQETFNSWPADYTPVAFDAAASPADFTASDGATGQPYVLLGSPVSAATAALAPSAGGEVPAGATAGGGRNPAAPGVSHANAGDPVDTENGDFTQSDTDVSVPTFGPALDFSRTYDAQLAQQQTQAGTPGPMGYGWTDNWASSLTTARPVPGDIYTLDGLATDTGQGGPPAKAALNQPRDVIIIAGGDTYIADTLGNRVEEIPGTSKTQWGKAMTAGDVYTIAGSDTGAHGASGNGTAAGSSLLNQPGGVAVDNGGDLYIADTANCRVVEIAAASGTQWGSIVMTAGHLYIVAGRTGQCLAGGDNKAATASDLNSPEGVYTGGNAGGDLYIADTQANRIQEVSSLTRSRWGQSMTANFVYTVTGSAAGTAGSSGDGGAANMALLDSPQGMSISSNGDLYVADTFNDRIQEVAKAAGTQWGSISMAANDIYTVAGRTGQPGDGGDNKAATMSDLDLPAQVQSPNGGNLYIADEQNMRVQEVAATGHTEWGQSMTANFVYTIAGSAAGTPGHSGDGGAATSAKLDQPQSVTLDGSGNLLIADTSGNEVRKVSASTAVISDYAGGVGAFSQDGDAGPAVGAGLLSPFGIASDGQGDVFIADTFGNRVQEIAASSHTQFGIAMTAGDVYTVAGQQGGYPGTGGDGGAATAARLSEPTSVAADPAGDLYIADSANSRIQEVSAATGTIATIAGSATGVSGDSGNGGPATAALLDFPYAVTVDHAGNVFIAGNQTNQVQEIPAVTGGGKTAGDIYTIAGSTAGTAGHSGDGGPAAAALLNAPEGIAADGAGNLYIADMLNNRIQEIPAATGAQWGIHMTGGDIYTIAGSAAGTSGHAGDGGKATAATLAAPGQIATDTSGDLYITDAGNNRIREIAAASGTQWGTSMTAADIYDVAGSETGTSGSSGDGGPATAALLNGPVGIGTDPAGDLFLTDSMSNLLREVTATNNPVFAENPLPAAITITQPGGAQITFYPKNNGQCTSPYSHTAGGYCALPQDIGAALTLNAGTYTFTPAPGTTYTYNATGQLTSQTDAAGDTLTISYATPAPGSGNCPATATTCDTVTSASGRALVLGLSSGRVTSVTDPLGRRWTYGYTGSDLTSATDPMTHITTYTYGPGPQGGPLQANDLLTITRPNAQPGGPDAGDATVNVYDAQGRVTSQTDPMGYRTTFGYSQMNASTGNGVVTVADPDGNKTVDYYSQGTFAAQSAWTGSTLTSEQDNIPDQSGTGASAGTQLDTATADGDGNITTYTYDASGNAVTTTAPDGVGTQTATTTQQFTTLNQPDCASDDTASSTCSQSAGPSPAAPGSVIIPPSSIPPRGVTWTLYDTDGNELYATTGVYPPGGSSASYAQTTYQLFKGNTVTLGSTTISCASTPPSPALPCATIDADGVVTQLGYNSAGDLTSSATPDGNGSEVATTTDAYDADGEQSATTSADGNLPGANAGNYTTTTAYNADGDKTTVTEAGGNGATVTPRTTLYGYDANGNQTTVQDARGYPTTTFYNAGDQSTLVTDPDGNATLTCYDGAGNTTQTVPPVGVAANSLTPASCPASYPSGYGNRLASDATTYTFDALGQKTQESTPAPAGQTGSEATTYSYDANGNLIRTTAPPTSSGGPNQVTVDTFNSTGELASQTTGYGTSAASTVSYCYDPNGRKSAVVYGDGNTSGTAPCETSSPWVISSGSNPTQAAYQTTYSYDSAGDLVSTTTPATSAAPNGATTTSAYDPAGNMLTSTDPNGVTTTWTYTPTSLKASVTYSGSAAHSVTYSHDANGQTTGMTDGTGTSSYFYDPFGELTTAANGAGQPTGYGYDADGNTTSITYPLPASATWANTDTVSYGFDHADQLTSASDFNGHTIVIGSTADGKPSLATLGATGDTITTTYDSTDMPSAITLTNGTSTLQSFTYSDAPAGNILSETDTPASSQSPATYTYDPQSRVTSMTPGTGSPLSYSFDASGNLITSPTGATDTYDKASELTSSTQSGTTTSYTYNADGQRLSASQGSTTLASGTWNGAGQLTSYNNSSADMSSAIYDGHGMRASTTITPSGGTAVTQNYLWNGKTLLMDSVNAYIYTSGIAPAAQVNLATGAISYLVTDSLGSVRGVMNSSGVLTGTSSYDAWGNPQTTGGLTAATPFGYAGGYTDPDGLIYLVNRYYDPATGQFTSIDPDVSQTLQPYAYAAGNPVSNTDPTGLTVNLRGVASWALAHVYGTYNCFGDDCTDFVSRALHYGGGDPMSWPPGIPWLHPADDHYWWMGDSPCTPLGSWSYSWSVAVYLAGHLVYKGSHDIKLWRYVRLGDIIFADWYGSSWSGIGHAGVITSMPYGVPHITQHSFPRKNESIFKWLNSHSNVHVWIYHPNAG